jgi:opacity protein-like surface antigen
VDVDLGFDDLFDVTEFGFQAYLELRKRKFGFFASPSYLKLSGDADSRLGSAEFEQDFWLVEGGGFYNFINTQSEKPFTLDAYAGVRYWNIDTEVEIKGGGPLGVDLEFGGTVDVTDPIIGVRMRQYLTRKLSLGLRGDVGGFGISEGETSDFSWHVTTLLGYDFNKKFTLYAGYRVLDIESEQGRGNSKREVDLTFQGALLGLQITW